MTRKRAPGSSDPVATHGGVNVTAPGPAATLRRCRLCGTFLPRKARASRGCCRTCLRQRRCTICHQPTAPRGETWCWDCWCGYQAFTRTLLSFGACRPPAGTVKERVEKYRRRAARGLPLFEEP